MDFFKSEASREKELSQEEIMENFYKKLLEGNDYENGVKKVSLEQLKELKDQGITTEEFLDYLCKNKGFLVHGSINEIVGGKLKTTVSGQDRIFAADRPSIAIMRSLYSNRNVNLDYPYYVDENHPLFLKIHTPPDGKFISKENGFIYIVDGTGFKNEPEGSWQFAKEAEEVPFDFFLETEQKDFKYPVEIIKDLNLEQE